MKYSVNKKSFFTEDEIFYRCQLLWRFEKELNSTRENYTIEAEKTRIDIAQYCRIILEPNILKKDLNKLMSIELFEQNDRIETITLIEYVPSDFSN